MIFLRILHKLAKKQLNKIRAKIVENVKSKRIVLLQWHFLFLMLQKNILKIDLMLTFQIALWGRFMKIIKSWLTPAFLSNIFQSIKKNNGNLEVFIKKSNFKIS